ncbi:hypothetical protein MPTK1_5g05780 [Marchantia polymorpha subsp. ruderalis]|uniref:Uncharacterized protein n=2 Tax=Marchantia polymorpha TaxID=3197 RepID=A0AAF6BFC1_MARPO|nr:hypothetical protein MARPO_0027s0049 [Marchantia polymorpha]BBN10705.1 hypothetical protein Mp_5g05780 [Marchantia polymorpha subsp. ruderalis]|eukprot:PTQ42929.1 hypothetical protein MARPO_0027s0049 [Marchantia polymorpha]
MSFVRPNLSPTFQKVQSFLLWFQMVYAVWQFVRTAKFFRLPYVLLSSLWHGLDSWLEKRSLIMINPESEVDKEPQTADVLAKGSTPLEVTAISMDMSPDVIAAEDVPVILSFNPADPNIYVTSKLRARHMRILQETSLMMKLRFGSDDDLLWPGTHLIRRKRFDDVVYAVLEGKGYNVRPALKCFFDCSSNEVLNQNFLRFASIWPLILQARGYDFWSVILSIFIIAMDLLSYSANMIWKFTQYWASRLVKFIILQAGRREWRTFWYTFMATVSTRFQCDNFVTGEASVKQVNQLVMAINIRLKRTNVDRVEPIVCSIPVPQKVGPGTSQAIEFTLDKENHRALAQPPIREGVTSSVHFQSPESIKVDAWSTADMAYFLQLIDDCNRLKCPPIKKWEGENCHCSTFAEFVHGVKDRKFVLCHLKVPLKLFIT